MELTPELLCMATGCRAESAVRFARPIAEAMWEFRIDSPGQIAHFLAQIAHESGRFERLVENLNYSWQRLMAVWPRRFPSEAFARQFHRQPEKIANYVYASRLGNGPPSTGDGWKYRGRGLKQLTGRYNYARCSGGIGMDLVTEPDKLLETVPAARSAAWYWADVNGNQYADVGDVDGLTHAINGGYNGLDDRRALTSRALAVMVA